MQDLHRDFLIGQICAGSPLEEAWRHALRNRTTVDVETLYYRMVESRYAINRRVLSAPVRAVPVSEDWGEVD
jgi:hypothetical protein